jgi:RND family efflux transporter MFP subunit
MGSVADEHPTATNRVVNLVTLALAVLSVGGGLFVYVDRDGPGRTEDAVVAADYIQVSANVPGQLIELTVKDNQHVRQGDLLFRLDPSPYEAKVEITQGQLELAEATLRDKQALYARTAGASRDNAVSRQALSDAAAARDAAQGRLREAQGQLDLAHVNLGYTKILAPFDGIVTDLYTQVGEWVSPGQTLFSLIDSSSFHVVAYIKEQYLGPVAPGAPAEVVLWQYPGETFRGHVTSLGRGVYSRNSVAGLPQVDKTLDWVQLAARIPVRIKLETEKPLTMGGTAHVRVHR